MPAAWPETPTGQRTNLALLAAALRAGSIGPDVLFPPAPEEGEEQAEEGRLLYRKHRARERNAKLVAKKKAAAGSLACEVCAFDFEARYGELGRGFVECDHLRPLADGLRQTRLADLALICSNCHRMAHRRRPWPTVAELQGLLKPSRLPDRHSLGAGASPTSHLR